MRGARVLLALATVGAFASACTPLPPNPERVAQICEERARDAMGPTGGVTIGVNSNTGGFASASIGVSSDYLTGRDPYEVYNQCYFERMGEAPIRQPRL